MKIKNNNYPFTLRQLTKEEGGGFLIEFPDLPGCISDGETVEEAIDNGKDAVQCWIKAAKSSGRKIPEPEEYESYSGKWVQRIPRSLHSRLVSLANFEGVSLNALVMIMIAEGLGKKNQKFLKRK